VALEVLGEIPEPRSASADRMRDPDTGQEIVTGFVALLGVEPWLAMEVSSRHPVHVREMRVYGEQAVAILGDAYTDHIALLPAREPHEMKEPEIERIPISQELPLLRELRAFLEHLAGGPPPRSSAAEGARQVEVLAALRRLAGLDGGTGAGQ
jgi:predicted dehydrogenase